VRDDEDDDDDDGGFEALIGSARGGMFGADEDDGVEEDERRRQALLAPEHLPITENEQGYDGFYLHEATIKEHLDEDAENIVIVWTNTAGGTYRVALTSMHVIRGINTALFYYECKPSVSTAALAVQRHQVYDAPLINASKIGVPFNAYIDISVGGIRDGVRIYFMRYVGMIDRLASHYIVTHSHGDVNAFSEVHCQPNSGGGRYYLVPATLTASSFGRSPRRRRRSSKSKKRASFGRRASKSKSKSKKRASFGRRASKSKSTRRR
jgi:hypothetical protein